ncbi:MAG: hypothetical protein B6241_15005 [Spirochaetaceae bacterium 4572_59]|nr:MAG: hypothetical protein B6241_15005 [Spirochaetaceae bacterium 4572_59]
MEYKKIQKVSITREQIREVYDQGLEAVENLVFSLVDTINMLIDKVEEQDLRIKKLEDQLSKTSRNSSKPPSTDSPYKNNKQDQPQ